MPKYMCCAPGCDWRAQYREDAPPTREMGAGYTAFAACPQCKTPDSVHYVCQMPACDERATGQKQWGWRCPQHRFVRGGRDGG